MRFILLAAAALLTAVPATADEPSKLTDVVDAYRAAKKRGDHEAAATYLSEDSRIWFEKKEGPGKKRGKGGAGPWAEWDEFFKSTSKAVGKYQVEGRDVSILMEETNDFYRLIGRPPSRYRATYYIDDAGKISGVLIASARKGPRVDRFDEFKEWARENRPDTLKQLMPEDEIVPSLENAKLWKKVLSEWRAATGLDPID